MHSWDGSSVTIHHNGDPEGGKLILVLQEGQLRSHDLADPEFAVYQGQKTWSVEVEADDIIDFVMDRFVCNHAIAILENISLREVIKEWTMKSYQMSR